MTQQASMQTRVLAPCQTLLGATGDALQNQNPTPLANGCLCFVVAEQSIYRLDKVSTEAVSSPLVIATVYGSAVPGRWVQITGDAATIAAIPSMLFCAPDFTGTPTGSIAAPFPTLQQALDAVPAVGGGSILMAVGNYPEAWTIPAKTVNIYAMGGAQGGSGGGVVLPGGTLSNGAAVRLENVAFAGALTLEGSGSLFTSQVGFSNMDILQSGAGGWTLRMSSDGLEPSDPGIIECASLVALHIEFQGEIRVSGATARIQQCSLENNIVFTGAAGTLDTDLSTLNYMRQNGAVLMNGTATAIDAPTLHETVALPAFGALGLDTVDVVMADAEPGDTFAVSNSTALPANAAIVAAQCLVSNTVRLIILATGASPGGNVDVAITRFNGG